MTIPEFIDALMQKSKDVRWQLLPACRQHLLRTADTDELLCPLEFLADTSHGELTKAALQLAIEGEDLKAILNAADEERGHDTSLRHQLLRAVGIEGTTI